MKIFEFLLSAKRESRFFDGLLKGTFCFLVAVIILIPKPLDVSQSANKTFVLDRAEFIEQNRHGAYFVVNGEKTRFSCRAGRSFSDFCFSKRRHFPVRGEVLDIKWIVVDRPFMKENLLIAASINGKNVMRYEDVEEQYSSYSSYSVFLLAMAAFLVVFYLFACFEYSRKSRGLN